MGIRRDPYVWYTDDLIHREEGILILSGGLTVHNTRDKKSFSPDTAQPGHLAFDKAVLEAVSIPDVFSYSLEPMHHPTELF